MTHFPRIRSFWRVVWPWLRYPFWGGLGFVVGFLVPYTLVLNASVQERFNDLVFSVPTRVYARPLPLRVGEPMTPKALELELKFAGYTHDGEGKTPGTWTGGDTRFVISSRGYAGPEGGELPRRIEVTLGGHDIASVTDMKGHAIALTHLDPARIATLYGAEQEERRVVGLKELPPLLVTGLQAVEDRNFNSNIGIDFGAIARAAWADLRAGRIVQGGSTLTQQLVRNLYLDRNQTIVRKFNEALLAILIKYHYGKERILEAYVNEVFLGQKGNQAVHGFAAAAEFYFGRRVQELSPADIALLVGLVRGPSYYNPRVHPERALARRNHVLAEFNQTGLLDDAATMRAQASPLGVIERARLPHDRFPAFMDLVRAQIMHDFSEDQLRGGGLSIFTTLDPAAQLYTEQAITTSLKNMGKRGKPFQAAAVVTNPHNGNVLAMVGSRDPRKPGFNRALDAHRSVGSAIKPFVYLVALAQPQRWSLASIISDAPVNMKQPDGSVWTPENDDHQSHGNVFLVDALVNSWNLATVHLGMAIGIQRVQQFLESFGLEHVNPNPSLVLGAIDLSPAQLAYLYQFIASGGHALPLVAVRGVTDSHGKTLRRYRVHQDKAEYQLPIKLITYAMQQVALRGTASTIASSGMGWLHAAGKTGTSDSQRDSWFAGFTGNRLGVFWMGRDDNKPTHLWGSSGSLVAWRYLFSHMPSQPLPAPSELGPGIDYVWIDPQSGERTKPECNGARHMPFIAGTEPTEVHGCFWQQFKGLFGGGNDAPTPTTQPSAPR
ncbi:MAG TPA: penicillin-binding protein 1B [Rhodanobacteraceae bacterium]|nr:penicillin-binding protein 1B [Rhodanobacteraceae bacterium]